MKRLLVVAAVLVAAAPGFCGLTQHPGVSPLSDPSAMSEAAPPAGDSGGPDSSDLAESTDRFKTGCGWCDPQVSDLGGTCVAFCGENGGGVSCAAAGEGEGAVEALMSREQRHRSPMDNVREVCRQPNSAEQPLYRWRRPFGGMAGAEAQRLRTLVRENTALQRRVESSLRKAYDKLRDAYGSQGYFQWTVRTERKPDPERKVVDVDVVMDEDKRYYVSRINFTGNETTRDKVIRREVYLNEGDVFNT